MASEATKTDDGGPAFPVAEDHRVADSIPWTCGMTLRDYFAAKIIGTIYDDHERGILADRHGRDENWRLGIAGEAYKLADAMLAHRAARKESAELSESIDVLDLSTRAWNVLDRLGCKTVGDVTRLDEMDLISARGSGKTCRREIGRKLAQRGLSLAARKAGAQ